jgi:hypothetical protein
MTATTYKDWVLVVTPLCDQHTREWTPRVSTMYMLNPNSTFRTQGEPTGFGLQFAKEYVDTNITLN